MTDMRQALYLIADEMRGMATVGNTFAGNIYEVERAHRIMALAADIAALADGTTPEAMQGEFFAEPWHRASPAIGVDAAVTDPAGALLLVRRRDNERWAMPGGLAEIGQTLAESVLRELWEEAGLRGRAAHLLGVFDGRLWGSQARTHLLNIVFRVECDTFTPVAGIEMLDARFFPQDALPDSLHPGHEQRIPEVLRRLRGAEHTYIDPADSTTAAMPMHQRPAE